MKKTGIFLTIAAMAVSLGNLNAQQIEVQVENLSPSDGFFFTPVWSGFHDGSFDLFNSGEAASAGLELIAEQGDFSSLSAEFAGSGTDGAVFSPGGFGGAPVFDPGETASAVFDISANDRYFSFASMIIPSNDAFIGNSNPLAYEVLDSNGEFTGPIVIEIFGADIYDAGTEVNDAQGAAFSALGGKSSDEGGVVALHTGLENFLGTDTAAGTTIGSTPAPGDLIARITINSTAIPEPSSVLIMTLMSSAFVVRRRR